MGSEFTFYDYINDGGTNVIHDWLKNEVSKQAWVKFNKGLLNLEGQPPPWPRPFYAQLDGNCAGLFEIRVPLDRQYRILGFHDDRKPTLVHCFIKRGARVPIIHCQRANEKRARVAADANSRRVEHNYGR